MANNPTYREKRVVLKAGVPYPLYFNDTSPNIFNIVSSSNTPVYISESKSVSATDYDIIVPVYGTRIYAKPNAVNPVWFYAAADAQLFVASMEMEFDPSMVAQTQEITGSSATGLLGTMNIKEILNVFTADKPGYVQDAAMAGKTDTLITSLAAILAKLSDDPATDTTLSALLLLAAETASEVTAQAILDKLNAGIVTTLFGSNPNQMVQQLNAVVVNAGTQREVIIDLRQAKTLQIFIAIDKNYTLNFYPLIDGTGANLSTAVQLLASNVATPGVGRTATYMVPAAVMPTSYGRITIVNNDATNTATLSLWTVVSKANLV